MPDVPAYNGESLEVLGTCKTNPKPDSTHSAKVEYRHLWSYAQQAALIAVSDKDAQTQCYKLIQDPERRAKRIAAHYADLYFRSAEKSKERMQLYWPALAAFVVKDIVEAFRFAREEVLHREWNDLASVGRNSSVADLSSIILTDESPYRHALRTYTALAKGNLWLFMDIYPWLWFFLEYGINADGSINQQRLSACTGERNWETLHEASKSAVEELPFGPKWNDRLTARLNGDPVYKKASSYFDVTPTWSQSNGYGAYSALAMRAHSYCRANVSSYDAGYRTPPSKYWGKFKEAFFVMECERAELSRVASDADATNALIKIRGFHATAAINRAYSLLIQEHSASPKKDLQEAELVEIAKQEQLNVLQPLIYNDAKLKKTMDTNHTFSRYTGGWLSPNFKVIYSASPTNSAAEYETVFDAPAGPVDRFFGERKSLSNKDDRMRFVSQIAKDFNHLMTDKRKYMEAELSKIRDWMQA